MIRRSIALTALILAPCAVLADMDDAISHAWTQADRLEYVADDEAGVWDVQGYYGGDYHKFWWKTEGDVNAGHDDEAELQLLYSRAVTAYFDWQLGLRIADDGPMNTAAIVIGLKGLAPYLVELDVATFIADDGDVRLRAELERDFILTQRFILQPRLQVDAALNRSTQLGSDAGMSELALGLRLRYEWHRKFAPYLGVSWARVHGAGAREFQTRGLRDSSATAILGVRFWF